MASRKRQLLDVLRAQHRAQPIDLPVHAPAEAPRLASASAGSRKRSFPVWLPLALRWGFGLGWVVLIVWLITLLWPDSTASKSPLTVPETPRTAPADPQKPAPGVTNPPAVSDAPRYGILAITYEGTANEKQATSIAITLRDLLQPQTVQVRKHTDRGKTWFEVFIGQAGEKKALEALLKQVRGLSLPDQPGKKPFADAFIKTIPNTTP